MSLNLKEAKEYFLEVLPKAGEILNSYFRNDNLSSRSKKEPADLVTEADEAVDRFLLTEFEKIFPGIESLTEETAQDKYFDLNGDYSSLVDREILRICDPLDGTVNFSRGRGNFAISEGIVSKGRTILGVVYLPQIGDAFWAMDGVEGFFKIDSQGVESKQMVSATSDLSKATFAFDWVTTLENRMRTFKYFSAVINTPMRQVVSLGSAVSDLTHLAAGELEVYVNCGLKPWDVAAVSLFIQKAGGKVTTITGREYNVFESDLLATNGKFHDLLIKEFSEVKV